MTAAQRLLRRWAKMTAKQKMVYATRWDRRLKRGRRA